MRITRRSFLAGATGLLSALSALNLRASTPAAPGASVTLPPLKLRGYGTLAATFRTLHAGQSSLTHVTCESPRKALLVQAKYLSDLGCLPGTHDDVLSVGGHAVPIRRTSLGGAVACFSRGTDALILAASSLDALRELVETVLPRPLTPADFTPRVRVPTYLDRWDRYGLISYFGAETQPAGTGDNDPVYDFADPLKFARDNGPLGLIVWTNPLVDDFAEGLTNLQSWSWVQENARKMGIPVHFNTQFAPPQVWLANRYREQTMLKAPQFLGGFYGVAHDTAGVGAISWLSQEAEDVQLGLSQQIVRQFAGDPNVLGWLEPHGETVEFPQAYFLESGPYADEVWRGFLHGRYGTLRALSERWHGDASTLKSWSDVHVPEIAEFAGFGPEAIDLRGTWRVKYADAPLPPEWTQTGFDDSGWDELLAPGNDRMLSLSRRPLVYRRTIDVPADWLTARPQVTLCVWDLINRDGDVTGAFVNGQAIREQPQGASEQHWSRFDVSDALKPGPNLLALHLPHALICYRTYLTKEAPRQYPHLGPHLNARWVDFASWIIQSRATQIRRGVEMIRQVDPDSSINVMAPQGHEEQVQTTCQDYGGRFHDTGAMAGFWTEQPALLMAGANLPVTAEPGNSAPNAQEFQSFWGRWLTEGVNGVHYFINLGDIEWKPDVLKVFEANRAMYEAVGKYHAPRSKVATLFSTDNVVLTGFPWTQDETIWSGYYSPYNSATQLIEYCPRAGIGAADFDTPLIDQYRVVIDSNTSVMSEELINGIERFVRRGGIFITNGQTGRHSTLQADAWPLRRLSGFEVIGERKWGEESVSPSPGQTIFSPDDLPPGSGAYGIALKPVAPDCRTLAVWSGGATAIGLRPLGAGWIVTMGPLFKDGRFVARTGAIMRHFGMTERVPATITPGFRLHFRHYLANTGLHDVWVLFNENENQVQTDLTFLPGVHPDALTDIVTGEKLEVVRDPKGDSVRGISLAPWESRMYLSPRTNVAASPLEWLTLQRDWWRGTKTPPAKHLPTPKEMQRFSLDLTGGWAYKNAAGLTDEQAASLARPELDDAHWERRDLGLWLTPGDHGPHRLVLRRRFTVPAHWTSGPVMLCADIPGRQFMFGSRVFLDGQPWNGGRMALDGPYFDTFKGVLKPGTAHVLTLDIGSRTTLTGAQGPIWLYYLPEPQSRQDLSGTWTEYADALRRTGDVQIPGSVRGMILSRSVVIDAAHEGRNVVIYYEAAWDRFSLLINGHLLKRGELFGEQICVFNVTPMVLWDQENLIELIGSEEAKGKPIMRAEIRYYDKGVYP